jgi:hypothetical protein
MRMKGTAKLFRLLFRSVFSSGTNSNKTSGGSWTLKGYDKLNGQRVSRIIIDSRGAASRLLVGSDNGLFESLDDGLTTHSCTSQPMAITSTKGSARAAHLFRFNRAGREECATHQESDASRLRFATVKLRTSTPSSPSAHPLTPAFTVSGFPTTEEPPGCKRTSLPGLSANPITIWSLPSIRPIQTRSTSAKNSSVERDRRSIRVRDLR